MKPLLIFFLLVFGLFGSGLETTLKKDHILIMVKAESVNDLKLRISLYGEYTFKPEKNKLGLAIRIKDIVSQFGYLAQGEYEIFQGSEIIKTGKIDLNDFYESDESFRKIWDLEMERKRKEVEDQCRKDYLEVFKIYQKGGAIIQGVFEARVEKDCRRKYKKDEAINQCIDNFNYCLKVL